MKKFLLSSVALLGFTAGAMAADLPRRAPPVFVPVPVFTWTGFYVGVNAGYGWNNSDDNTCLGCFGTGALFVDVAPGVVAPVTAAPFSAIPATGFGGRGGNSDGFVGGAQVGFNYQFTPGSGFVVGVEADIQWMGGNDGNNGLLRLRQWRPVRREPGCAVPDAGLRHRRRAADRLQRRPVQQRRLGPRQQQQRLVRHCACPGRLRLRPRARLRHRRYRLHRRQRQQPRLRRLQQWRPASGGVLRQPRGGPDRLVCHERRRSSSARATATTPAGCSAPASSTPGPTT